MPGQRKRKGGQATPGPVEATAAGSGSEAAAAGTGTGPGAAAKPSAGSARLDAGDIIGMVIAAAVVIAIGYAIGRYVYDLSPLVSLALAPALFVLGVVVVGLFLAFGKKGRRRL